MHMCVAPHDKGRRIGGMADSKGGSRCYDNLKSQHEEAAHATDYTDNLEHVDARRLGHNDAPKSQAEFRAVLSERTARRRRNVRKDLRHLCVYARMHACALDNSHHLPAGGLRVRAKVIGEG